MRRSTRQCWAPSARRQGCWILSVWRGAMRGRAARPANAAGLLPGGRSSVWPGMNRLVEAVGTELRRRRSRPASSVISRGWIAQRDARLEPSWRVWRVCCVHRGEFACRLSKTRRGLWKQRVRRGAMCGRAAGLAGAAGPLPGGRSSVSVVTVRTPRVVAGERGSSLPCRRAGM